MTTQYTPGPWSLDATNIVSANGTTVIDKGSILWNFGEGQANARLIAAAPDLFAACEQLVGLHGMALKGMQIQKVLDTMLKIAEQAQVAIAKATGGEK